MAVPALELVHLRFQLHSDTDGYLTVRRRRSSAAAFLDARDVRSLLRLSIDRGIEKVRLTGEEPAEREDLAGLVGLLSSVDGIRGVCVTTRGAGLADRIPEIAKRGLSGISFNLDTLDRELHAKTTGGKTLESIWRAVEAAVASKVPVKINVVLRQKLNVDEIDRFVDVAVKLPVHVRFLEWNPEISALPPLEEFVPAWRAMAAVRRTLVPESASRSGPARVYRVEGGNGAISFIPNISEHFCASCNQLVLTDHGEFAGCVFGRGINLLSHLQSSDSQARISAFIDRVARRKGLLASKLRVALPAPPPVVPAAVLSSAAFASGFAADGLGQLNEGLGNIATEGLGSLAPDRYFSYSSEEQAESTAQ